MGTCLHSSSNALSTILFVQVSSMAFYHTHHQTNFQQMGICAFDIYAEILQQFDLPFLFITFRWEYSWPWFHSGICKVV